MAMNSRLTLYRWMPLILVGIMVLSSVSLISGTVSELNDGVYVENTDARQSPTEQLTEECDGITFEEMFTYTHGIFDVTINDDWKSADVWGFSWVNGSKAAEVRKDIDDLMTEIPGNDASNPLTPNAQGGDGQISTDERDALEEVGSACVERTVVRFGLNDILHREGSEWNNMSWVGETLLLSDQDIDCVWDAEGGNIDHCPITMVHEDDPTWEDGCDGKGDGDCQWVDVESERNFVLWVHGTTTFEKIDYNNFTLSINSTNMSSAKVKFTFPSTSPPIQLSETESQLNCENEWNDDGTIYTADCLSVTDYDKPTLSRMVNSGNNYQFETNFAYDFSKWPATDHNFFDFTTAEPEDNNPPEWTESAPAADADLNEENLVPIMDGYAEQIIFTSNQIYSWYYDDYSAPQMICTSEDGPIGEIDNNGNIVMIPFEELPPTNGDGQERTKRGISCQLVDGSEQTSGHIFFTIVEPLTLTTSITEITGDFLEFTVDPNEEGVGYVIGIIQEGVDFTETTSGTTGTSSEMISISEMNLLKPGSFMVSIAFSGNNVISKSYELDLGLSIPNTPPIIQITDYNWLDQDNDGIVDTYVLSGQVSDPDGEDVTLTITMNGGSAGTITVNGAEWTTAGIPFYAYDAGDYTIVIQACDASDVCKSVEKIVPNLYWAEAINDIDPDQLPTPSTDDAMPAPGFGIALAGIGIALFASRKREF